jgi:hypothetical protein
MRTIGSGVGVAVGVGVGVSVGVGLAVGVGESVGVALGPTVGVGSGGGVNREDSVTMAAVPEDGKSMVGTKVGSIRAERLQVRAASAIKDNAIKGKIQLRRLIGTHYQGNHGFCQRTTALRFGNTC